jgi:hypothetical protein
MLEHDERPWWSYTVLAGGAGYKVTTAKMGP